MFLKKASLHIFSQVAISQEENANILLREALKALFSIEKAHMYICHKAVDLAWNYTDSLVKELHSLGKYPRTYVNIQVNGSTNDSQISAINTGGVDIKKVSDC